MNKHTWLTKLIIFILLTSLCLTILPSISFATTKVKTPTKVTLVSVKAGKTNNDNKATVTIKWKKVKKNTTGYQLYQKIGSKKWKLVKTLNSKETSVKVVVSAGKKNMFKVRAINKKKVNGKTITKIGKFSTAKSIVVTPIPTPKPTPTPVPESPEEEIDFGSWEYDDDSISFSKDFTEATITVKFTNYDEYSKDLSRFFIVQAIQGGIELKLISGGFDKVAPGLKVVRYPFTYRLVSDEDPILFKTRDVNGEDWGYTVFDMEDYK